MHRTTYHCDRCECELTTSLTHRAVIDYIHPFEKFKKMLNNLTLCLPCRESFQAWLNEPSVSCQEQKAE